MPIVVTPTPDISIVVTPVVPVVISAMPAVIVSGTFSIPGATSLPAGEILSALRVVSRVGNQYFYSDPSSDSSVFSVVGIIKTSAAIGQNIEPINNAEIQDSSWVWVLGKPIFLGSNGTLTQISPLSGWLQIVAKPLTTTTLLIELSEPIRL